MVKPRSVWEAEVDVLQKKGEPPHVVNNAVQQRGRDLRKFRLFAAILDLMLAAEKGKTVPYQEFSQNLHLGSHWERNILLGHLFALCRAAGWPCYLSIVIGSDPSLNSPSEGFFTACTKAGIAIVPNRRTFVDTLQKECFGFPLPDEDLVAFEVLKYFKKV